MAHYVLVGGGIAATQAAETIRSLRSDDPITLVAEEAQPFYMRPLLADLVAGRLADSDLWRNFESVAEAKHITLMTGRAVQAIDRAKQTITLADGEKVPYDSLLVATGVKPALPQIAGVELEGVTTLSNYGDALRLTGWAEKAKTAVVVGRGLQGVELTRALRLRGLAVTMIVPDQSPWFPALFQVKGEIVERALEEHGVKLIPLDMAAELVGKSGRVAAVRTREGREVRADIVGFALEQRAQTQFLAGSGVSLADGVVVDRRLQSTDPRVYAAGDVAQVQQDGKLRPIGYGWVRAANQGEAAARNMVGETATVDVGDESEAQSLYGRSLPARWR